MKIASCDNCGACCSIFAVALTPFDILRIVKATGRKPSEFVAALPLAPQKDRRGANVLIDGKMLKLALKWSVGRICVFYSKERHCTVHGCRPMACRSYPFEYKDGEFVNTKLILCAENWIPKDKGPWIKDFNQGSLEGKEYQKIADEWNGKGGGSLKKFLDFALKRAEAADIV